MNARTQLASCLFYSGEVDEALHQLQMILKSDPKNVNALFNLGVIRYKGKMMRPVPFQPGGSC